MFMQSALDALAFQLLDVFQLLADLIHHSSQVVALHQVPALLPHMGGKLPQSHAMRAIRPPVPLLHHALECSLQIAMLQVVIGERIEQGTCVQIVELLAAVPSPV